MDSILSSLLLVFIPMPNFFRWPLFLPMNGPHWFALSVLTLIVNVGEFVRKNLRSRQLHAESSTVASVFLDRELPCAHHVP